MNKHLRNEQISLFDYLERKTEQKQPQLPFDSGISIEGNDTLSQIFKQVKDVVYDLKSIHIKRDVNVRRTPRPEASTVGAHNPQLPPSVTNGHVKGIVRQGEEIPIANLHGEEERQIKKQFRGGFDLDMVEMDSGDPNSGIRRVEDESGGGQEEEERESDGVEEATSIAAAGSAGTVGGEDYDDVLVW